MAKVGKVYTGSGWESLVGKSLASYQASAPVNPQVGDIWIDSDDEVPGITSSLNYRWRRIATGGETSISGNDVSGLPLSYNPGYEQLYLNGVLQYRGSDYVATTGNTITGLTALVANDTIEVLSFVTAPIGDTYTQAAADAKFYSRTSSASSGEASTVNINTKPWNMPWGIISVATVSTQANVNTATLTDLPGMTSTFTAILGRLYKATFAPSHVSGVSGERGRFFITGTNISNVKSYYFGLSPGTSGFSGTFINTFSASSSGSTTVKIQFCRDSGSNNMNVYADAQNLMLLIIEDIGPA